MPSKNLTCTLLQQALYWKDPAANRRLFAELIDGVSGSDLIVLPEMFTAGFSMDVSAVAEPPEGETLQWMAELARRSGAVITGSYAVMDGAIPLNRLVWMRPDGHYCTYVKRHLFRMSGEHQRYRAGSDKLLVELKGWRVCPMVCYDLRFPVWCRNQDDYDLLVFVANWPAVRALHWSTLLKARAIENLACVIGVNRIGEDGRGNAHSGDSVMLDARGKPLLDPGSTAGVFTATYSAAELNRYRDEFPAHLDADKFQLL